MPSPRIRCKVCGHRIRQHAAKCPYCGKVYKKSSLLYFALVVLVLAGIALLFYSFTQGQQQTQAAQREIDAAASEAGIR